MAPATAWTPDAVRLPRLLRTTPFRLTLLFLALFAASAGAFLGYIYVVTAGEATRRTDREIAEETRALSAVYRSAGRGGLVRELAAREPAIVRSSTC
ncbi:MAG: hypothetical protein Q8M88_00335 [Phenylobacterium sp.]|uniref:hypothetical protein n=1 Tax=Phenylobacterium sp. TaxID=1871053 RepID=UPI002735F5B1|nr:hypothetical protein [Phenylobacterium sp.]MDP3172866.1 hypothetical protein [Phenylobacterium sp.]